MRENQKKEIEQTSLDLESIKRSLATVFLPQQNALFKRNLAPYSADHITGPQTVVEID